MKIEEEADQWPPYDGLGDENDEELPVQEGDLEGESLDHLEEYIRSRSSGLDYYDQFVQQALFWLREELSTELLIEALSHVRATLSRDYGTPLRPVLRRPLTRLKRALEEEDPDMALQLLIKLQDVLQKRPEPVEKPRMIPRM